MAHEEPSPVAQGFIFRGTAVLSPGGLQWELLTPGLLITGQVVRGT